MDLCPILRENRKFDDMFGDSYYVIVKLINWVLLVSSSRSRSVTNTQRISDSPIISDRTPLRSVSSQTNSDCHQKQDFSPSQFWKTTIKIFWIDLFRTIRHTWVDSNSIDDDPGSIIRPFCFKTFYFLFSQPPSLYRPPTSTSHSSQILIHSHSQEHTCYGLSIITKAGQR